MDSLDAGAVFEDLGRRIHSALRREETGWGCQRAVPRIDGSLYMDLTDKGGGLRLDWLPEGGGEPDGSPHLVFSGDRIPPAGPAGVIEDRVSAVLQAALAGPSALLLGWYNRDLSELVFDERVVDRLLAGRFGRGQTRWFDYCFQDSFQPHPEAFRLTFGGPRGELVFEVRAARQDPPPEALVSNHVFHLLRLKDPRTEAQRRLLTHQVERFLGFLLSRAVHPRLRLAPPIAAPNDDPAETQPEGPDGRPGQPEGEFGDAPVSTTRWGNPLQWHQFFSDFEVERAGLCSLRFTDPIAFVVHGETECMTVEPHTFTPLVGFANLPWPESAAQGGPDQRGFFTGLVEQDTIQGGTSKLERALAQAAAAPGVRLVCLNNTCLPKIIGDDVASTVARARRESGVPILSMNTDLDSPDEVYRDLVDQTCASLDRGAQGMEATELALVGTPPGPGRQELIDQLGAAGVGSIACLLPEFGVEALTGFLSARTGLVYPHGPWLDLADQLLADLGVPLHPAPSPYGFEGTRRWVRAAAEALGDPGLAERWQTQACQPLLPRWEAARREAAAYRLAMVVDRDSLQRLVQPARLYGFALLPLLEEMGFGLDVLILDGPDAADAGSLLAALERPDRLGLHGFASQEELAGLLQDGEFGAVYSEVFFDQRISRAGKAQFHLGMLGMGLGGALAGIRDLIDLCRWPFYRRYGRLLSSIEAP